MIWDFYNASINVSLMWVRMREWYLNIGRADHFFLGAAFFWAFWAALSWAFWAFCFSLFTVFLSPCFLAIWAFFLSLISLMASSASAFLSSALAFFSLLMVSRVIPSMALFYSLLSSLLLFTFPVSDCFIFLWSLLQAVAHLNLWAFIFLYYQLTTSSWSFYFSWTRKGKVCHP